MITISGAFAKSTYNSGNNRNHYHGYIHKNKAHKTKINLNELDAEFWQNNAKLTLNQRLKQLQNTNIAKNVILFLGDGMSITTLAAARTHLGQRLNKTGEETFLSFEKFPYTGLSKTYCVDRQVADSACSATAYLCGIKANEATIGVTAAVKLSDCATMNNKSNHVYSIASLLQTEGKRTGLVTTTRVTHASPAGVYAHTANRNWEADTDIASDGKDPNKCIDIAQQLIHGDTGQKLNVIFGGGRYNFLPNDITDEDNNLGWRSDGRNLLQEWKQLKNNTKHKYIYNLKGLKNLNTNTKYVLGIFDSSHMAYNLDRDVNNKPSLSEMTKKAIEILSQGKKGFFLFVEGGRIDHAHHENLARKALDETIEFHEAVKTAVKMTDEDDTLIVVTSDHAHTMTLNGYPNRGNNILSIAGNDSNNLPYTTLSYANGPSAVYGHRPSITTHNLEESDYKYPSLVMLDSETHGGEDVAIFANGPWAHLFTGVTEQHVIPHILSYASCVGNYKN